jgi:hypothetical protein
LFLIRVAYLSMSYGLNESRTRLRLGIYFSTAFVIAQIPADPAPSRSD